MSTPTTTAGLPFITDAGLMAMAGAARDNAAGRTYVATGIDKIAAVRKLVRDGYLDEVFPGCFALAASGQLWAKLYREATEALNTYTEVIRHPDGNSTNRMVYAAYLGRVEGHRNITAAALLALFPGLGWDTAKSWAVEAACDMSSVLGIAAHYGEDARR